MLTSKLTAALTLACLIFTCADVSAAIVVNGGFEEVEPFDNGNPVLHGWTIGGNPDHPFAVIGSSVIPGGPDGIWMARFGPRTAEIAFDTLSQTLTAITDPGAYLLDFYLFWGTDRIFGPQEVRVLFDGVTVFDRTDFQEDFPSWTHFLVPVTANNAAPVLSFEIEVRVGHIYLDGVAVAPAAQEAVPEPASLATWSLITLGCLVSVFWRRSTKPPQIACRT